VGSKNAFPPKVVPGSNVIPLKTKPSHWRRVVILHEGDYPIDKFGKDAFLEVAFDFDVEIKEGILSIKKTN
jgi:hypothetical protein